MLADLRVRLALAAAAGAALSTAFAPMNLWLLGLLSPALLMALWQGARPRHAAALGFWFSFGTFASGTYWLYISIHTIGAAPVWVAFIAMGGMVCILSLYGALLGWASARWLPATGALRWMAGLPAAWLLVEWFRGWFLTGFPWLSLGYSQTGTWMAGIAPVLGVYGVSALLLLGAGALVTLGMGTRRERLAAVVVLLLIWVVPGALRGIAWTKPSGPAISIAIVQGDIPEDEKLQRQDIDFEADTYRDLTRKALGAQVIFWPEAALPDIVQHFGDYMLERYHEAYAHHSAMVVGMLRENSRQESFNSIMTLADSVDFYDKMHLVPFTEVIPGPAFAHKWLQLLDLPYQGFTYGGTHQPPLSAGGLVLLPAVCYDDAYGSDNLHMLRTANALVTVTNDAWFGHSTARYQHLQIAQMRAIETGRYLIRAANDGVSGVIGPDGRVLVTAPGWVPTVLRTSVIPMLGLPPYARVGNWLIISLAATTLAAILALGYIRRGRHKLGR
ncbi:MAG TPA: apolipoprotein N-acyltransferase [Steroidobacteraceae bacterium]|nr:apolipoprotein N-acyltransferase [Steroidobacteraceae bacterium]